MGLVLGGIFSQSLGWRYIFYITAPIGILVAVLGVGVIPKDVVIKGPKPALDIAGSVLGSASMVLLVFVLSSGGECEPFRQKFPRQTTLTRPGFCC